MEDNNSDQFYQNLDSFKNFHGITENIYYHEVPSDWKVVITDIKGSTKAIEEGRYKDVNTVGAASIVSAQNAMKGLEYPYVFGGDGATLLIPPGRIEKVKKELIKLKQLSKKQFNLELRVGVVDVQELNKEGYLVEVAKFQLVANKSVAAFKGGGLTKAEKKVKGEPEIYEVKETDSAPSNLEGLSCHWQPIPNKHGIIISLLVQARVEDKNLLYQKVIQKLENIFKGTLDSVNPIDDKSLSHKGVWKCIAEERKKHNTIFNLQFFRSILFISYGVLVFKFHLPDFFINAADYKKSLSSHSDYRKFDEMLRMIIDCSRDQANEIEVYLESLYQEQQVFYGLHRSFNSLMTCFVEDLQDGSHIHFIDGGNGGYAMAAKHLKKQMKTEQQ